MINFRAMQSIRFRMLGMFSSLFGIFVLCFLYFGWTSQIIRRTNSNCRLAVNIYQFKEANFNSLNKLVGMCRKDGIYLKDKRFNIDFLKDNLRNFICTKPLKYLNFPNPLVALASFPGSGNTWTRELAETVTGFHTGNIYSDDTTFAGSQMCPSRGYVFIIKTHKISNGTNHQDCLKMGVSSLNYTKAIFILRNPYNALLAEYNRQNAMKPTNKSIFYAGKCLAPANLFGGEKWKSFVKMQVIKWKDMTLYWLDKFNRPVYLLIYERLRKRTLIEMYNVVRFLNISVAFGSLYCIFSNSTGNFQRIKPKWMTIEKLYDKKMSKYINTVIETVNARVGLRRNITDILHSYILPAD